MAPSPESLEQELAELIAIPSISADPAHATDVLAAAAWVRDRILRAGGTADVIDWHGRPLVVGEVRASTAPERAPTVLCYGHFDVQPADPLELWETEPFEPPPQRRMALRAGDRRRQGAALHAAEGDRNCSPQAGELPVNVRFACDGEEEIGGSSIVDWLVADERGADVAVVFDGGCSSGGSPSSTSPCADSATSTSRSRTGRRDLHSGMYGGAALNAMHALSRRSRP